jgi:hypothetical protein
LREQNPLSLLCSNRLQMQKTAGVSLSPSYKFEEEEWVKEWLEEEDGEEIPPEFIPRSVTVVACNQRTGNLISGGATSSSDGARGGG